MQLIPYIGIPYKPRGVYPASADCWTLIHAFAANELGLHFPEFMYDVNFLQETAAQRIMEEVGPMGRRWTKVEVDRLGDIILFRMRGLISHCAISIGDSLMLHTLDGRMSCIEPFDNWIIALQLIHKMYKTKLKDNESLLIIRNYEDLVDMYNNKRITKALSAKGEK